MKFNKLIAMILTSIILASVCGCSKAAPEPSAAPTNEPTEEHTYSESENGDGNEPEADILDEVSASDFEYIYNNELDRMVLKYIGTSTDIRIPDKIEETPVTDIAYMFEGCTELTSVAIPGSVTIPDSVTSIGTLTFAECRSLTATYKGNTYYYKNLEAGELYEAINGQ